VCLYALRERGHIIELARGLEQVLQQYAIDRFLHRLSKSKHTQCFDLIRARTGAGFTTPHAAAPAFNMIAVLPPTDTLSAQVPALAAPSAMSSIGQATGWRST